MRRHPIDFSAVLFSVAVLAAGPALLALGGCGALDTEFEPIELQELVKTGVPDANHHYRVKMPKFAAARRNTGIVRDGPLFLIAVGPNLKSALNEYGGPGAELGVRLMKQPRTHLVIERVFTKDQEINLFEGVDRFRFDFPDFATDADIPFDSFEVMSPLGVVESSPRMAFLNDLKVEKAPPSEALQAALPDLFRKWPKRCFYLVDGEHRFVVSNADVSTLLILDWMAVEPRKFKGGIVVEGILEKNTRRELKVLGAVDIRWIDLGSGLFFRSRPDLTE